MKKLKDKINSFISNYNLEGINYPSEKKLFENIWEK